MPEYITVCKRLILLTSFQSARFTVR